MGFSDVNINSLTSKNLPLGLSKDSSVLNINHRMFLSVLHKVMNAVMLSNKNKFSNMSTHEFIKKKSL